MINGDVCAIGDDEIDFGRQRYGQLNFAVQVGLCDGEKVGWQVVDEGRQ